MSDRTFIDNRRVSDIDPFRWRSDWAGRVHDGSRFIERRHGSVRVGRVDSGEEDKARREAAEQRAAEARRQTDTQRPGTIVGSGTGTGHREIAVDGDEDGVTVNAPVIGLLARDDMGDLVTDRVMVGFRESGWVGILSSIEAEDA